MPSRSGFHRYDRTCCTLLGEVLQKTLDVYIVHCHVNNTLIILAKHRKKHAHMHTPSDRQMFRHVEISNQQFSKV